MAQVPEQTLSWLYSRLHDYHDPQRAYTDVARALSAYPSLPPRTDAYTNEVGVSALLLNLDGTIPANFRGTIYRFPIKLWVPQTYPQEPPVVYVQPNKDMLIRPGQHVGVDGRVYHPYLRDWSGMWDRANLVEFLDLLQQVFAKETPVISRAQQQQLQRPLQPPSIPASPVPAGPPQLPPKPQTSSRPPAGPTNTNTPPPRPPKPGEEYAEHKARDTARTGPPPPPLPYETSHRPRSVVQPQYQTAFAQSPASSSRPPSTPDHIYQDRYSSGPPPPPLPYQQQQPPQYQSAEYRRQFPASAERTSVSPVGTAQGFSELPSYQITTPSARPPQQPQQPFPSSRPSSYQSHAPRGQGPISAHGQPQAYPMEPQHQLRQPVPQQAPHPKPPAVDLLSDPFDVSLPASTAASVPAPPIPPNPEKEHLLQVLSQVLVTQAQQKTAQNLAAVPALRAQHAALQEAHGRLQAELQQVTSLSAAIHSNTTILHNSIAACDDVIASTSSTSSGVKKQPNIDDLLLPTSSVATQLWSLCADEAACREAMYVLQRALDRGRLAGDGNNSAAAVFVKQMRQLGRECFLKMALARKCARGLGLDVPASNIPIAIAATGGRR